MAPERQSEVRTGSPSFRDKVQELLRLAPGSRPAIYAHLFDAAALTSLSYWLEIVFAAGIATLGLVLNSPAVIIGAMLISPLMGPIMAAGLALSMGDLYLGIRAVFNLAVSIAVSVVLAAAVVWLLPFHSPTAEIFARTNPNLLDLGVAILSGLAGSIVLCRGGGGGGVTALPGVAIAVALMPPLCTMGFGLGSGGNMAIVGGAGLLFLTNLVAIVASAFLVFALIRMDSPDVRAEIDLSRAAHAEKDALYVWIRGTAFARALAAGGRMHWRILMLAILLGTLYVPLRTALQQVRDDVVARNAVQGAMRQLAPDGAIVSDRTAIGRGEININLISTQRIDPARIEQTRRTLIRQTGRNVEIAVQEVASKSDLQRLLERMSTPRPAPLPLPPPPTVAALGRQALDIIGPVLQRDWPAAELPLVGYELAFSAEGPVLRIRYQAVRDLQPEAAAVLRSVLRDQLEAPALALDLIRQPPPRPGRLARRSPPK